MPEPQSGWSRRLLWQRFVVLVALGAIAALGQAPYDLWPATLLGLTALLLAHPHAGSASRAAFQTFAFGLGYAAFALRWIVEPFLVDIARHGWMAPFALLFMAVGFAAFWTVAAYVAARLKPHSALALALGLVWAELARSLILTGFPWALLGHIWVPTGLAQLAALGGPHLLTLLVLLASLSLAYLAVPSVRFRTGSALMLVALTGAGLWLRPGPVPEPVADAPMIRLVQPNAAQDQKWNPAYRDQFINRLVRLTSDGARPDLVVWPETAVPTLLNYIVDDMQILADAARGAPLVFGIQRTDEIGQYYNSLAVLDQQGAITDLYDKRHLVPFGEYIPGGTLLGQFGIRGLAATEGAGFAAGRKGGLVTLPGIGRAIPLICYEGIFAEEIARGSERPRLMVLITNDAWFGKAAGPFQHLAQARLRAIEQGLPMVRVANTGISAMIDPQGRITAQMPLGAEGAIDAALPVVAPATPYGRSGDWPMVLVLVLLTIFRYLWRVRDSD